jgi:transcriptional regulator with XRE-family HTH domain
MNLKNIYLNIKTFRNFKDITREYIASELDISVSGYSKIERGEVDISLSRLGQILEILDVDIQTILHFDPVKFTSYLNKMNKEEDGECDSEEMAKIKEENNFIKDKYIELLEKELGRHKGNKGIGAPGGVFAVRK